MYTECSPKPTNPPQRRCPYWCISIHEARNKGAQHRKNKTPLTNQRQPGVPGGSACLHESQRRGIKHPHMANRLEEVGQYLAASQHATSSQQLPVTVIAFDSERNCRGAQVEAGVVAILPCTYPAGLPGFKGHRHPRNCRSKDPESLRTYCWIPCLAVESNYQRRCALL